MKTICNSILEMRQRDPEKIAVKFKKKQDWASLTWSEYYSEIERIGAGLQNLGIRPGDRVSIFSNTRYEWAACDLASLGIQAITVPIYQNSLAEDVEYILNNAEVSILICENKASLKVWSSIKARCPTIKHIVCMDSHPGDENLSSFITLDELKNIGEEFLLENSSAFRSGCENASIDDRATIIYTSGTTGKPKGVVLTHRQIMSEVGEVIPACGVSDSDISLSFLPFAHVMGRVEHWAQAFIGFTVAYAESIDRLRFNLLEIRPTFLVAVPRIFEKIYTAILGQLGNHQVKQYLFKWAMKLGKRVSELKQNRQPIPIELLAQYLLAKRLVLDSVLDAFGGNMKFAICGGAPLSKEISTFFHAAGLLILEGYGLSETTAAVTINTPFHFQFGTVGSPAGEVKIKIADDGEILVQSEKVMLEYYKNPEATAESIRDGWFYTGDIGEFTTSGCLKITDRKKDLIKTAGGKYVAPQKLEELLKAFPLISQTVIYGDEKKYIVALITIDRGYVESWAKRNNVTYVKWTELCHHPDVIAQVRKAITEVNQHLASWETVKKYLILPVEFTVESGELTPSLKIKRKELGKKYKKEIESLY